MEQLSQKKSRRGPGRTWKRIAGLLVAGTLLLVDGGCGRKNDEASGSASAGSGSNADGSAGKPATGKPSGPVRVPADGPAERAQRSTMQSEEIAASPMISISVDDSDEATLGFGEPLMIEGSIWHSQSPPVGAVKPLLLSVAGPWTRVVGVKVRNGAGEFQNWPLRAVDSPGGIVSVDRENIIGVGWYMTPEESARLAPGTYELTGVINTTGSTDAGVWRGICDSGAVKVRVKAPSEANGASTGDADHRIEILAKYDVFRGDAESALTRLDAALAGGSHDFQLLVLEGDILESRGKKRESQGAYQKAIEMFRQAHGGAIPDSLLRRVNVVHGKDAAAEH